MISVLKARLRETSHGRESTAPSTQCDSTSIDDGLHGKAVNKGVLDSSGFHKEQCGAIHSALNYSCKLSTIRSTGTGRSGCTNTKIPFVSSFVEVERDPSVDSNISSSCAAAVSDPEDHRVPSGSYYSDKGSYHQPEVPSLRRTRDGSSTSTLFHSSPAAELIDLSSDSPPQHMPSHYQFTRSPCGSSAGPIPPPYCVFPPISPSVVPAGYPLFPSSRAALVSPSPDHPPFGSSSNTAQSDAAPGAGTRPMVTIFYDPTNSSSRGEQPPAVAPTPLKMVALQWSRFSLKNALLTESEKQRVSRSGSSGFVEEVTLSDSSDEDIALLSEPGAKRNSASPSVSVSGPSSNGVSDLGSLSGVCRPSRVLVEDCSHNIDTPRSPSSSERGKSAMLKRRRGSKAGDKRLGQPTTEEQNLPRRRRSARLRKLRRAFRGFE